MEEIFIHEVEMTVQGSLVGVKSMNNFDYTTYRLSK